MCRTTGHVYYVAGIYPLWSSRKPLAGGSWESPRTVSKTLARAYGLVAVAAAADTVHIAWMDRRHDMMRINLTGPRIENCDIYYRRRRDADPDWSKDVQLSEGMLYSYAPSIAAEGSRVVVAWAGIEDADRTHTRMSPNDIFFVTSNDGGVTWSERIKVTYSAKDGVVSGMPQVALLNGTIHLLFTQGSYQGSSEASPGLRKLELGPWPIYYTHREFPK